MIDRDKFAARVGEAEGLGELTDDQLSQVFGGDEGDSGAKIFHDVFHDSTPPPSTPGPLPPGPSFTDVWWPPQDVAQI